jgi:hypothetical protein
MAKVASSTHCAVAARSFNASTLAKLARRGITLVGTQMVPDYTQAMPFACASTAYVLNDRGTCRVRSHGEVLAIAAA